MLLRLIGDIVVLTAGDPHTSSSLGDYTTSTNVAMGLPGFSKPHFSFDKRHPKRCLGAYFLRVIFPQWLYQCYAISSRRFSRMLTKSA